MKRLFSVALILLSLVVSTSSFGQNKDTAYVNLTNFKLFPTTFSWRGTNTFYDMTSWDSSPFTEGHLKQLSGSKWLFKMNYRLLFPGGKLDKSGWDPSYKPGYPMIVFLHGGGERGNCWDTNCYCKLANGTPCDVNGAPIANTDVRFLNNDGVLTQGGQTHLNSVVLAGTKKPNDPTLDGRAFPGFLLYAQNVNAWGAANSGGSDLAYAMRIVRLLQKQYNIDPDRIYIHGLSLGGQGMYKALNMVDWMFAAAGSMSGLDYQLGLEYDSVANIPLWVFQGATDTEVTPSQSASLVKKFRQAGGIARYTLYPTLGHGTWNAAYAEPDFFTWFLSQSKANIHVPFGNPNICGTTGAGVNLTLAQGFYAYQWERDGQLIPGATSYTYMATIPGIYRARFSRVSKNPVETEWNRWSDPVTIGEKTPDAPILQQTGTIVLSDLNNNKNATLTAPDGFEHYYWYKDGVKTTFAELNVATISGCAPTTSCANTGAYTLITAGFDLCPSLPSKPKYVVLGVSNSATTPPIITLPSNFNGTITSPSSILFTWSDNSKNERGYEIWRKTSTDVSTTAWKLAVLTDEDITQFHDTGLTPGTTYYYKIRAVNNTGRSDYFPGNSTTNTTHHRIITLPLDNNRPTPAQNLTATVTGIQTVKLTWQAAVDDSGIKDYYLYYNSDSILLGSNNTTYTFGKTQLVLNTNYNFTVRAVDLYGNLSFKSNQATANTYVDGLYYEHSTGAWTNLNQFAWTTAIPEFTGKVSNITLAGPPPLGPRTQDDYFNFKFYGYLYINTASTPNSTDANLTYAFQLNSNDGAQLLIDDAVVTTRNATYADGACSSATTSKLQLTAGAHKIEIRYFDYTGSQCLELRYKGPDTKDKNGKAQTILVPASQYKSYNTIVPPVVPLAITNLTATAASMTQINLAWTFSGTLPVNYEVYRSTTLNGAYTMIGRVSSMALADQNLTPGTTYYYKIKTVSDSGTSPFSAVSSASTLPDSEVPTQPTSLATTASTFTTVSLIWTASTDNVKVTGYEIWANSTLIGTSPVNGFIATGLTPNSAYSFYVKAYDATGNKSIASNTVAASTSVADVYYSNASGPLNVLTTWGKNTDGSGVQATTFTNNGQYFIVSNRTTSSLGGIWSVNGSISKVIVPNGVTLTVDNTFTAQTEVQGTGIINLTTGSIPQFVALSPGSTVNYYYTNLGNAYVQQNTYGNLGLYGTGNKVFASGTTTVKGDITTDGGVAFKGAPDNTSKLIVGGNITVNGAPAFTAPDFGIDLELSKNGSQSITANGDLYFEKVTITGSSNTTTLANGGTPYNLNLGTYNGGGLSIPSGSTFGLGNNGIILAKNSSINGNGETGRLALADGSLDLTSTSNLSSHLYFDPTTNTGKLLNVNLTGGSSAIVHEPVKITDGIKMKNGTLSSGGNITLVSNATKTASIQEIEGTGAITGNVNVQRYIDAKGVVYRYISTSVAGTTEANWETYFPLSGLFLGYVYDHEAYVRMPTTNTSQYPIQKGRGYSVYLRNGANPITVQVSGNPYQGNVTFPLDPDPSASNTDGWNLLGNPYASSITWSNNAAAWTRSGVSSSVSVRNNPEGVFMYYDYQTGLGTLPGGKIAPGQAFWVQTNSSSPSLIVTEKAKVNEQQTLFRQATNPVSHVALTLKQGSKSDIAFIAFTNAGTDNFDNVLDAVKQNNEGMYSFSSLTSNKVYAAINNMSDDYCSKSIKLKIANAPEGSYALEATEFEGFEEAGQMILHDNFTNTTMELAPGGSYNFNISKDTASYGGFRFVLVVTRPTLSLSSTATTKNLCDQNTASVTLTNTQAGASYFITNQAQDKLSDVYVGNGSDISVTIPVEKLKAGINDLKVKVGFAGCTTQTLPQNISIDNEVSPLITTNQSVLGCKESSTILTAEGAPQGGSYKWFDSNKTEISGATGASFETTPLGDQAVYYVSALTASGCESEKVGISITGQDVEVPSLALKNDTLFASSNSEVKWFRNGNELEGVSGMYYIPVANGTYKVVSNQNGCSADSKDLEYIITNVEESADGSLKLLVYPNPAPQTNLNFKVNSTSPSDIEVQFVDMLGRKVYSKKLGIAETADGYKVDGAYNIKNGVYFIIVSQNGKSVKKRVVVLD